MSNAWPTPGLLSDKAEPYLRAVATEWRSPQDVAASLGLTKPRSTGGVAQALARLCRAGLAEHRLEPFHSFRATDAGREALARSRA